MAERKYPTDIAPGVVSVEGELEMVDGRGERAVFSALVGGESWCFVAPVDSPFAGHVGKKVRVTFEVIG